MYIVFIAFTVCHVKHTHRHVAQKNVVFFLNFLRYIFCFLLVQGCWLLCTPALIHTIAHSLTCFFLCVCLFVCLFVCVFACFCVCLFVYRLTLFILFMCLLVSLFLTTFRSHDKVWIGLSDGAAEGVFRWINSGPAKWTNFATGQPDGSSTENCVVMDSNGTWSDEICDMAYTALCQMHGMVCRSCIT